MSARPTPDAPDAPRTTAQNRRLWAARQALAREAGEDVVTDLVAAWCREATGTPSTRTLTVRQAWVLIEHLEQELSTYKRAARRPERRPEPKPDLISARQQQVLGALYTQANIRDPKAFCKSELGVPWVQTQTQYTRMTQALGAMVLRQVNLTDYHRRVARVAAQAAHLTSWEAKWAEDVLGQLRARQPDALTPHKYAKLCECELRLAGRAESP